MSGRHDRRVRLDGEHLRIPGRLRGQGRTAVRRLRSGGEGGPREAGPGASVREDAPRARRLRCAASRSSARRREKTRNVYLLNSINPFRIEGSEDDRPRDARAARFDPPDWIALPAGNLGNTSAFGKALLEARELGLITRLPRLACIQALGRDPLRPRGLSRRDCRPPAPREGRDGRATAIKIGDPASLDRAIGAGPADERRVVADVTDRRDPRSEGGRGACPAGGREPASAASVAGVRKLVKEGVIRPGVQRVVAVLTGPHPQGPRRGDGLPLPARAAPQPAGHATEGAPVGRGAPPEAALRGPGLPLPGAGPGRGRRRRGSRRPPSSAGSERPLRQPGVDRQRHPEGAPAARSPTRPRSVRRGPRRSSGRCRGRARRRRP